VDEVAVGRVELQRVDPGLAGPAGRGGEVPYDFVIGWRSRIVRVMTLLYRGRRGIF